jgi:chaperonin GroES
MVMSSPTTRDATVAAVAPSDDPSTAAPASAVPGRGADDGGAGGDTDEQPVARSKRSDSKRLGRVDKLPIKMLNDRILVKVESEGERRSSGGILIPATAQIGKRLAWAQVVAVGPNVRAMEVGDQVLFNPEDRYEVEVRGDDYIILRERDIHAVAAKRLEEGSTGLYL